MKTRSIVLAGLGLAIAATALYLRTEKGKKLRNDVADNLKDWREKLSSLAMEDGSEDHHEKRASKQLKHT